MHRVLAGTAVTITSLVAQAQPDWAAIADQLSKSEPAPAFAADIPMDVREWSKAVMAGVSAKDRARLFDDGLQRDDLGRAVAITTLLAAAKRDPATAGAEQLYEELISCHVLNVVSRSAEVNAHATATAVPEWLQRVREPARARARALLARMLREHVDHDGTMRAIALGALRVAEEQKVEPAVQLAARRAALSQLGERARADDYMSLYDQLLEQLDLEGARAALQRARVARQPFALGRRQRLLEQFEVAEVTLGRVETLQQQVAAGEASPLVQLQLARAIGADDVDERCRALVKDGCEHALPDTILAFRALMAGRREEAMAHTERARTLPGGDEGVAVLVAMLQWPAVRQQLQQAPDDEAVALRLEVMMAEIDAALGEGDNAVVGMLRELRDAGWPMAPHKEVTRHLAKVYGGQQRAPASAQEYALAMAGVLAGLVEAEADVAAALRFLKIPVAASLQARPILMRQRAACATTVSLWAQMADASDELRAEARELAAAARRHSHELGDVMYAAYLELVERWVAADRAEAQRAVIEDLRQLEVSPIQSGAWLPGSTALVFGRDDEGTFDRDGFVALRMVTGRGRDPLALVPLAVLGATTELSSSRQMVEYLRETVRDERARNLLAVAEIAGGASPAVASARATKVLASEQWSDDEARELANGVWLRFRLDWGLNYNSSGPQLDVRLTCEPILLPKLRCATRLESYRRRR